MAPACGGVRRHRQNATSIVSDSASALSAAPPHRNPDLKRVESSRSTPQTCMSRVIKPRQVGRHRSHPASLERLYRTQTPAHLFCGHVHYVRGGQTRQDRQKRDDAKEVKHGTRSEKEERTYFEPVNLSMGMGGVSTGQETDRSLRRTASEGKRRERARGGKKVNQEKHFKVGGWMRCKVYAVYCILCSVLCQEIGV